MVSPSKSLVVVMNGPDASAGLNPNLFKISGVIVPMNDAKTMTLNNAILTTVES